MILNISDSANNFILTLNRIETVNFWCGIVLSTILLLCIVFRTRSDVGNFKYLQLLFVLTDVSYSTAAYLLDEKVLTHEFKFCLITLTADNLICVCVYCTFFCAICLIVAVNFIYRLWAVRWPEKIRLFGELWFNASLTAAAVFILAVWFFSCYFLYAASPEARAELSPQLTEKYGLDAMTRAMIVGDYYRDGHYNLIPLLGLTIFTGLIASVVLFMAYASFSIISYLKHSKLISDKAKKLQYALFRMLACQTAVPLVLVHGCAGAQLFVPLTGLNIQLYSDISTVFLSFFTPIDALVVIVLIRDYRTAIWRPFQSILCSTPKTVENHSSVFSNPTHKSVLVQNIARKQTV